MYNFISFTVSVLNLPFKSVFINNNCVSHYIVSLIYRLNTMYGRGLKINVTVNNKNKRHGCFVC